MKSRHRKLKRESVLCIVILAVLALSCIIPMMIVLIASVTPEEIIQKYGYQLFPDSLTLDTYIYLIGNRGMILLKAFMTSLTVVVLGTVFSVFVVTCYSYAVTQKKEVFRFARPLSFFAWFTTIFSGGVLPWYILCTQYYGMKNNIWALTIPYGMNVWNMFILRGSFRQIPEGILESARLDGASNGQIFVRIAIPMAKAGIVTVTLFNVLMYWNDFFLPQWLISDPNMQTFQKLLYNILSNAMAVLNNPKLTVALSHMVFPQETMKMALAILAVIPVLVMYPFSLKYFVKGINVGGIKG